MADDLTIGAVPKELVLRVCEALLADSTMESRGEEVMFHGVALRYIVIVNNEVGYERHMLVGRDWNCGFNLVPGRDTTIDDGEPVYDAFMIRAVLRQMGMEGEEGFDRDMTVLYITYNDWKLDTQPPLAA